MQGNSNAERPHMLDETDTKLLRLLQRDASLTAQQLGEKLHLSASQAGRRRAQLEQAGYITAIVARLDAARLGLGVQAFIQVQLASHQPESARSFARMISARREIVSAWTMTGEADHLLRVWCTDLGALNRLIHEVLLAHPSVARVMSQIVMDQIKADAPLPV